MMRKPRIFVSSTIYDFKDLRSALKYWLSGIGFEVRMSERNDFGKDSSQNSYQACLDSIRECDYYILFIGSRAGGMYSTNPKITITQMEYRYACKLAEQGIIKRIIIFVRQSIWDIKADRNALKKYIEKEILLDEELQDKREGIETITKQSSTIIKNSELIFNFIEEVSKIDEMRQAIKKGQDYPKRNWVNIFNNFEDIVDVLKVELNASWDIDVKKWNNILIQEISENLARISISFSDGKIFPVYRLATLARNKLPERMGKEYHLKYNELTLLREFAICGILQGSLLSIDMITAAINSGVYLEYDSEKGQYVSGNIQRALVEMLRYIKAQKRQKENFGINEINQIINRFGQIPQNENVSLKLNSDDILLFEIYAAHDYQFNIYNLSKYLLGVIEGKIEAKNYPKQYKEGVFEKWGDKNVEGIISPQGAYEACMMELEGNIENKNG